MKNLNKWLVGSVVAVGMSSAAFAGISATKHNLSSTGTGPNHTTGTGQICVFCHTPHGSDTAAAVPLWNKTLPGAATFTTYDALGTSSLDGGVLAVGSVSLACLSCHDGAQAMDNMINDPGSGSTAIGGTWTGVATMAGTPFPVLGKDLKNDHPIGIEYCGGGLTGTGGTVSGTCRDLDFVGAATQAGTVFANAVVKTKDVNGAPVFWVETGTVDTTRQKTDLSLYTRDFTSKGGAAAGPSVECASCHDPHVESKGTDNIMFMRVTTDASKICLSCHVK